MLVGLVLMASSTISNFSIWYGIGLFVFAAVIEVIALSFGKAPTNTIVSADRETNQ